MPTHGPLQIEVFVDPFFQENGLLIWPTGERACWIIDPSFSPQPEQMLELQAQRGLEPQAILLTHCHVDHLAGVNACRQRLPHAPLWAPRDEAHMLMDPVANLSAGMGFPVAAPEADRLISPGEVLELGSLSWRVLDVAGHSPGGLAFYCAAAAVVIAGDALFSGGIGRHDFPGSSETRLLGNIRANLLTLPDETVVYSGHGPSTTIGEERKHNPFVGEGVA